MQAMPSVVLPFVSNDLASELAIEKDGYNRPLDMVLSAKISDMKATVAAPYWKRAAKQDGKGPEMAMLRNKAMSLAKDLENLLKLHERQETVVADLRAKLRHLRQDGATKDKKLELAHRTIERLSVDKHGLEAGDAAKKTYIRQLECRVAGMKSTSELELLCGQLQAEIQALKSQIEISQEKAAAAEESSLQHQSETQFLRRGIQLAAEQLARSSGADVSASLLMAVARGQNEAVELSSQLAEAQGQVDEMAGALTAARTHLQAQHEALLQWQQWETTQSEQAAEREEALKHANEVSKKLHQQVEMLQAAVHEARRERDAARHRLELEKTARQDSEEKTRALQTALRQSEQNEIVFRAEIQRLVVSANALRSSGIEPQAVYTRPHSGAGAVAAAALPPTRPQSGAGAHPSPTARYPLDASIAALERELAQMAAHPALVPPSAATAGTSSSPLRRLQQQQQQQQQQFSSPQRRIQAAGGTWHTNPLASPEFENPKEGEVVPEEQTAPTAAPSAAQSLTDSAAWRLLEHGFDQQRAEDRRMNALWQHQNEEIDLHTSYQNEEEEESAAISLTGPSTSAPRRNDQHQQHHNPTTTGLRVEVPDTAASIATSPGIASNRPGMFSLVSPDLGQFSARASAEWLNGSLENGFKQLEDDGKKQSTTPNGSGGVTVHAYAGMPPVQQQERTAAGAGAEKPRARQSLFDLARMELKY